MADEDLSEETAIKLNMSLDELIITHSNHFNEKSYKGNLNKSDKSINSIPNNKKFNSTMNYSCSNFSLVTSADNNTKSSNFGYKKNNLNKKNNAAAKTKNFFPSNPIPSSSSVVMTSSASLSGAPPPPPPKVPPPPVTQVDVYNPNHIVTSSTLSSAFNVSMMPHVASVASHPTSSIPPLMVSSPAAPPPPLNAQPSPPAVPCPPGAFCGTAAIQGNGNIVLPPVYTPPPPPVASSSQSNPHFQSSYVLSEDNMVVQSLNSMPMHFNHTAVPGVIGGDANKRNVLRSANDRIISNLSQPASQAGGPPTPRLRPSSTSGTCAPSAPAFPQASMNKEMILVNGNAKVPNSSNINFKNLSEKHSSQIGAEYSSPKQREYFSNEIRPSRSLILRDAPHAVVPGMLPVTVPEGDVSQMQMPIRGSMIYARVSPGVAGVSHRSYGCSPPVQEVCNPMAQSCGGAAVGRVGGLAGGGGVGGIGSTLTYGNYSNVNVPYNASFTASNMQAISAPPSSFYNSNSAGGASDAGNLSSGNRSSSIVIGGSRRAKVAEGSGIGGNAGAFNALSALSHSQMVPHGNISSGVDGHNNNNRFVNSSNKYVAQYTNSNEVSSSTYVRGGGGGGGGGGVAAAGGVEYASNNLFFAGGGGGGAPQGSSRGGSWAKESAANNSAGYRSSLGNAGGQIDVRRMDRIGSGASSLKRDRAVFENSDIPYALSSLGVVSNRGAAGGRDTAAGAAAATTGETNDYYNNYNYTNYGSDTSNMNMARASGGGAGGICVNERESVEDSNGSYNWSMSRRMVNSSNLNDRDELVYHGGRAGGGTNNHRTGSIGGGAFPPVNSSCSTYVVNDGNYMNCREQMKQSEVLGYLGGRVKDIRGIGAGGRRFLGMCEDLWCNEGATSGMKASSEKEERLRCRAGDGGIGMAAGGSGGTKSQQIPHAQQNSRPSGVHANGTGAGGGGGVQKGEWGGAGKPVTASNPSTSSFAASNRNLLEANNKSKTIEGYNVIVTNVPHNLTAMEIQEAFSCLGSVIRTDVMLTSHGEHTGRVCVMYASKSAAEEAVCRFDGGDLNGNTIRVFQE